MTYKHKIGALTQIENSDIGNEGVIKSAVESLKKDIKKTKGLYFYDWSVRSGQNGGDFVHGMFTIVLTCFTYKKPRFIKIK